MSTAPPQVYEGLRQMALNVSPSDIGLDVSEGEPYGVLVDIGYPEASATLVTFSDGTASLYFSTGGGILGGGAHEAIRRVAKKLIASAKDYVRLMESATDLSVAADGDVRFFLLTPSEIYTHEAPGGELASGHSALSGLFRDAHHVITELRLISQ